MSIRWGSHSFCCSCSRGSATQSAASPEYPAEEVLHHQPQPTFTDYVTSSRFWFESFQNWQSEFFAIASMVWLAVYLRQRWLPESKPVHAPRDETGH